MDTELPFWVANDEPEPPLVVARLSLDRAVAENRQRWWALSEERLTPLFGPEPPAPFVDDEHRRGRYDNSGAGSVWQLDVEMAADDAFTELSLRAGVGADRGRLDDVVEAVLSVLRDAPIDPLYGQLTVDQVADGQRTALDVALGRSAEYSAASGRAALRGYEWATVCPAELAGRIDRSPFAEVTEVAGGALLLRATPTVAGWTPDAARTVFAAMAPALPHGLPADKPGHDLSRVVMADAAQGITGNLPVGPPPLPAAGPELVAALTEFVSEAMRRGWLTTEPMDDSAPPEIRNLFPAGLAMGLTPEGQRNLAERLGIA